jgi:hypothetical protein
MNGTKASKHGVLQVIRLIVRSDMHYTWYAASNPSWYFLDCADDVVVTAVPDSAAFSDFDPDSAALLPAAEGTACTAEAAKWLAVFFYVMFHCFDL